MAYLDHHLTGFFNAVYTLNNGVFSREFATRSAAGLDPRIESEAL